MQHMKFYAQHKTIIWIGVVFIVLIGIYFGTRDSSDGSIETQTVERVTVRRFVEETGVIKSAREADLSLAQTGQVASILVVRGDAVSAGDVLVRLDQSEQQANLLSARAQLKVEEATLADMKANAEGSTESSSDLSITKKQQQVLIENTYTKLLSEGLVAEPTNDGFIQTPPIISGRYTGPEGTYNIDLHRGSQWKDYEISVFDLETVRGIEINNTTLSPLGTRGLFVSFPDPAVDYMDTRWTVTIPNTQSSSYLANYNAYIAAKESGKVAVAQAEVNIEKIRSQEARVEQARAAVAVAQAQLSKRTLRAPFSGIITDVHVTEGEVVSPTTLIVSIISDNSYEIVVDIPESDIAHVSVEDTAVVTFDAYDDEVFTAHVIFITPSAKVVDDVSTFEATLRFDDTDERIRAGLSADVEILAAERMNTLAVPSRAVIERNNRDKFVRVVENGSFVEVSVQTGLRGSDGLVEIIHGLVEGDEVITFISEESLKAYEAGK